MKLYSYWRSSCAWRVRTALHYKNVDFTLEPVHLVADGGKQFSESYQTRNPMSQVPLLEFEEWGQVHHIAQSVAILEFLEERFPEPALLPQGAFLRAKARQLTEIVNSGTQPLQNIFVLRKIKNWTDDKAWAQEFIARGLTALEKEAQAMAGVYLVGDQLTFADLCLVPQLYNARRFEVDVNAYPTLLRVEKECTELPAFQKAHPNAQPDAESNSA